MFFIAERWIIDHAKTDLAAQYDLHIMYEKSFNIIQISKCLLVERERERDATVLELKN